MKKHGNKWCKHIIKANKVLKNGESETVQYVVIGKEEQEHGLFVVSPFTDFIQSKAYNKTSTQLAYANVVVPFLNYVYDKPDFEMEQLTVQDGIDFLNSIDVSSSSKLQYSGKLEAFYMYLKEKGIIDFDENAPLFKGKYKNSTINDDNRESIHNMKEEYIPLFISTAIEVVPEIALGVYFCCFGGLRNSEIVSVEYKNISFKCDSSGVRTMIINLEDKDLRPDTEYGFLSKNKKNRKQEILPVCENLLYALYEMHKDKYKQETTDAVFIDEKNMPMTNYTYANKFNNLKKAFISKLEEADDFNANAYAMELKTYKWKTHICRGIFSNFVAKTTNNLLDIALWRGDSNIMSALTYLNNKEELGKCTNSTLDELYAEGYRFW